MNHKEMDAWKRAMAPPELETLMFLSFSFGYIPEKSRDELPENLKNI